MAKIEPADLRRPIQSHVKPVQTTVRADQTVQQALDDLRQRTIDSKVIYFYVLDEEDRLKGVVATRALLLSDLDATIESIMHGNVVTLTPETTLEEALEVFAIYRLWAFPVVDHEGKLLGVIDARVYVEEMFDLAESTRVTDLYQLIGMTNELARHVSPISGVRLRMPWLTFNLVGGLACAVIGWLFEATLDNIVLLAMFIPLVLTLSESISMQSVTLSLQMLHGPKVPWHMMRRRLAMEWQTAPLLGAVCAAAVGLTAMFWGPDGATLATMMLSVILAMVAAGTLGMILPAVLHAMRLDPKVAAGPVVLMIGDMITMTIYLGLATWWLM